MHSLGHVELEMPVGHSVGDVEMAIRFPSIKSRKVIKVKEIYLRAMFIYT